MRYLFRPDPRRLRPGMKSRIGGVVDLVLAVTVLAALMIIVGYNVDEVGEVIKFFKSFNDIFVTRL